MPTFRFTIRQSRTINGVRIERGMQADVVSRSHANPLHTNGGKEVADAFMRIYGIDLRQLGVLNSAYIEGQIVG